MKLVIGLFALLLIIVVGGSFGLKYINNTTNLNFFEKTQKATINKHTFKLMVADTPEKKEIGLSDKTSLAKDSGMLFPFNEAGYYYFWMKNMKFPIDIIFIKNGKIVTIHKNLTPPTSTNESLTTFTSTDTADSVLEINAGLSDEYKFKTGDDVKIEK